MRKKANLVETVYKALPNSEQIHNLDLTRGDDSIAFDWRSKKLVVTIDGEVSEKDGSCLKHTDFAAVASTLIKRALYDHRRR